VITESGDSASITGLLRRVESRGKVARALEEPDVGVHQIAFVVHDQNLCLRSHRRLAARPAALR